ncbi:hypothetical protein KIL84_012885, partial [Mauremys mutica]
REALALNQYLGFKNLELLKARTEYKRGEQIGEGGDRQTERHSIPPSSLCIFNIQASDFGLYQFCHLIVY